MNQTHYLIKNKIGLLLFLFPLCYSIAQDHYSVEGKIVDSKTNEPIQYVNVFLSQTSIGSTTNDEGFYRINSIPKGRYKMVASIIGHKQVIKDIELRDEKSIIINFNLEETTYQLRQIEVEGQTPVKWREQLELFKKLFFGENKFAEDCVIQNESKLEFLESEVLFTASINEPLKILNNALGYNIECVLKNFSYDKRKRNISYEVYPSFSEIVPSTQDSLEDFIANREEAYLGSTAHLLTTLADSNKDIHEEGFEIYYLEGTRRRGIVNSTKEIVSYDSETGHYLLISNNGSRLNYEVSANRLGIEYSQHGKNLVSHIAINYEKGAEFDPAGYFVNPNKYILYGSMAKEGMATMLPRFWKEQK